MAHCFNRQDLEAAKVRSKECSKAKLLRPSKCCKIYSIARPRLAKVMEVNEGARHFR